MLLKFRQICGFFVCAVLMAGMSSPWLIGNVFSESANTVWCPLSKAYQAKNNTSQSENNLLDEVCVSEKNKKTFVTAVSRKFFVKTDSFQVTENLMFAYFKKGKSVFEQNFPDFPSLPEQSAVKFEKLSGFSPKNPQTIYKVIVQTLSLKLKARPPTLLGLNKFEFESFAKLEQVLSCLIPRSPPLLG